MRVLQKCGARFRLSPSALVTVSVNPSLTIFETIAAVLLVMGVGFLARRTEVLSGAATSSLGRVVADITFPALCFKGLIDSGAAELTRGLLVPALGFITLGVATAVGAVLARVFCDTPAQRPTFTFCVAVGNWIFLPLPIAQSLYGASGTTVVLLNNTGAQLFLWTFGILVLRGGKLGRDGLRALARNPGLWATALGIVVALAVPHLTGAAEVPVAASVLRIGRIALTFVAGLTVPLVTVAIGAQLAEAALDQDAASGRGGRPVLGVLVGRMIVAPAIVIGGIAAIAAFAPELMPPTTKLTEYLIAAMPVSLSTGALVQRYDGDVRLASKAIAVTTVASVVSVPLLLWAVARFGG